MRNYFQIFQDSDRIVGGIDVKNPLGWMVLMKHTLGNCLKGKCDEIYCTPSFGFKLSGYKQD